MAASGGRDSTALLHATARAAREAGIEVLALHVHHGLQPQADDWVNHLQAQCAAWRQAGLPVELHWRRLKGHPDPAESVEAWARRGRYAALARMAREGGAGIVLLAHHRRDQAETFALQALRGAGAAGLSAMPAAVERGGLLWLRPWLNHPVEAIEAYVLEHDLQHVDDPSNGDRRFARNRLRNEVMPLLRQAFPQAESALAAAAAQAQLAQQCMQELAAIDLSAAGEGASLRIAAWIALSPARRLNLLRHWLRQCAGRGPSDSLLQRLLAELPGDGPGQWPFEVWTLRRYRGLLSCVRAPATAEEVRPAPREALVRIEGPGRYPLPGWGGHLRVTETAGQGLAAAPHMSLELRERSGGEQFQAAAGGIPRSLKKQYQQAGVPAWLRDGPLLWSFAAQLVFVPGLGVDARLWAPPGSRQFAFAWEPCERR